MFPTVVILPNWSGADRLHTDGDRWRITSHLHIIETSVTESPATVPYADSTRENVRSKQGGVELKRKEYEEKKPRFSFGETLALRGCL